MTGWLDRGVSARVLVLWACALAPPLLLPASVTLRGMQMVVLGALALSAGRRLRWLRTGVFFAAVVCFNLAAPGGRVLIEVVGFPITSGALRAGLGKALALSNLLLLSRVAIRRDLELPGTAGALISLTLAYVRYFLDADLKLLARDPAGRLDRLLLAAQCEVALAGEHTGERPERGGRRQPPAGVVVLGGVLAANWAAVLSGAFAAGG